MADPLYIAQGTDPIYLLPRMTNRHGLITGASGTGKTVTLQVLAEQFSRSGVPVFVADVKGDLAGISQSGSMSDSVQRRLSKIGMGGYVFSGSPVTFWDVFGQRGHPVRTTISEIGPVLLSRMLELGGVQTGVLNAIFKIADDQGLLLLDLADLRAMLEYVSENSNAFRVRYGQLSKSTIGTIQRNLLGLGEGGTGKLFGEPALDLYDMLRTDASGRGMINLLSADRLFATPQIYSTLLLWLLALLYGTLPEVGDQEKPKFVFFFDEAHLLFTDTPKPILKRIDQLVRLIRSKGVGIFFVTQNPADIPDLILSQLGNRVQHALHAFTVRDQKAIRAAAQTFRQNPDLDLETAITQLGVGEALISFLDAEGMPSITERALVVPPHSRIGPISDHTRYQLISQSLLAGKYDRLIDRESAYELLSARAEQALAAVPPPDPEPVHVPVAPAPAAPKPKPKTKSQSKSKSKPKAQPQPKPEDQSPGGVVDDVVNYAGQRVSTAVHGKVRGVLGSFWGGK